MSKKVNILMATYNGDKYIKEQIDSVLGQTYKDFNLFICDDGSTDNTIKIIQEYVSNYDNVFLEHSSHLGACQNFANLIRNHRDSEYIMLCDQDDVWDSKKIEKSLNVLEQYETEPALLYSDKVYVDENLNELNMPNRKYKDTYKSLLFQCHIYGCTVMLNKRLIEIVDIPQYASMHDHWISLLAAYYGKIIHLDEPLMLYRQHSDNVTGGVNQLSLSKKLHNWKKTNKACERTICTCYSFCKLNDDLTSIGYVDIFANRNIFRRFYKALKFGYKLDHFTATLRGLYVLINAKIS